MRQLEFLKSPWQHRYSHGGQLRQKRRGRGARPLSTKEPAHLVFKATKAKIKGGFRTPRRYQLLLWVIEKYAAKFFVRIEQLSIQNDHIHILIRTTKRSNYFSFFRVVAGQISVKLADEGLLNSDPVTDTLPLWRHRPFTRVVRGYKAYKTAKDYIQLNEMEARGEIRYRKDRLSGLSNAEWEILWS